MIVRQFPEGGTGSRPRLNTSSKLQPQRSGAQTGLSFGNSAFDTLQEPGTGGGRCVIGPRSRPKVFWDLLVAFLIMYSVVSAPYRAGFSADALGAWNVWENLVDCLFGLDILLTFFTAAVDREDNQIVYNHKRIAWMYLRSWFLVDAVSTFPFGAVGVSANLSTLRVLRLARLLKLLRLFRLARLTKNLEFLQDSLSISPSTTRVVSLFLRILFLAHLIACLWFFVCQSESAAFTFVHQPLFRSNPDSPSIAQSTHVQQYLALAYFVLVTIFGVGYGDFVPVTSLERIMSILLMLIGSMSVGLIIGSITSTVDARNAKYTERLAQVKQYLRDRHFPLFLQRKVKRYFHYFLNRKSMFDEQVRCPPCLCAVCCVCV